jgi:hypothetical protein
MTTLEIGSWCIYFLDVNRVHTGTLTYRFLYGCAFFWKLTYSSTDGMLSPPVHEKDLKDGILA